MDLPRSFKYEDVRQKNIHLYDTKDDIFIVAASFEERASALQYYLSDNYKCEMGIIYVNEDNSGYEEYLKIIESNLAEKCNVKMIVQMSNHRILEKKNNAMLQIVNYCREYEKNDEVRIAIDITCFSRIDLIILLDYITSYIKNSNIKLIYSSPLQHGEWLSRGYSEINNIIGFSGIFEVEKPTALVVLSGFEADRPLNFIDVYEPDKIFLGISNPAILDEFGQRNLLIQKGLFDLSNVSAFNFSARNIGECLNNLEENIAREINNYNIVIAPLCTKLTTVATFLFAKRHPEVQLAYCYPQEYNVKDYSVGIKHIFIDCINQYFDF